LHPIELETNSSEAVPSQPVSSAQTWPRRWAERLLKVMLAVIWCWCLGAAFSIDEPYSFGLSMLMAIVVLAIPVWAFIGRLKGWSIRWRRLPVAMLLLVWFSLWGLLVILIPSNERQWSLAQQALPQAIIEGEQVTIEGIRSFRYGPAAGKTSTYTDQYDLSQLESVWFGVDRFTDLEPMAHTFLSFGFAAGSHRSNYLAFSVETRREVDEDSYSPLRGIYNNYELIYVIADEQDVLSVRSDVRENIVQLYPVKTTPDAARHLFLDMLQRANGLHESPEFYHTLKNNCTNNIVYHVNKLVEDPISTWQRRIICPGYSDWLAMELGLIDTELPLAEAREHFRIDQKVKSYDGTVPFSEFIRSK
jgi:hypothetical protein